MRLILHVGHGKTGTSWLQSWLAINSYLLENKYNIRYIVESNNSSFRGQFSMGNSYVLEPYLSENILPVNNLVDGLSLHGSLLFSGEKLMKILPQKQRRLEEIALSLGTERPELVLMLRNPFDHALSLYNQKIKSQGLKMSFANYLPMYDLPDKVLSFLRTYPSSHIFHYDNYRTKLYAPLLELLSLPYNENWSFPPFQLVNRSLSQSEIIFMRLCNYVFPKKLSKSIGKRLISFRPSLMNEKFKKQYDDRLIRDFNIRWRPIVDEINSYTHEESRLTLPAIDSFF